MLATVAGEDVSDRFRKDICGAWIMRTDFGNRESKFGWEIDHIISSEAGGSDESFNLRPMQWKNKLAQNGRELVHMVTAIGKENVEIG